jgi:tetratricopeptide (TPR) repeat protein
MNGLQRFARRQAAASPHFSMSADHPRFRIAWLLAIALMAVFVAWRVLGLGMAETAARHQPEVAPLWRSDQARALRQLSQAASDAGRLHEAAENARGAIRANPLDGRAYAALARALTVDDVPDTALASIAARRWPLDPGAHAALADHHLREGRLQDALPHYDALLRVDPESRDIVFPLLLELLTRMAEPAALAEWLGQGTPWRSRFLAHAAREIEDPAPMHHLMQALHATEAPPGESELRAWLARLERDGRFMDAYFSWLQALPPERLEGLGNLYNGNFQWEIGGYGFDWRIGRVPGATIERAPAGGAEGDHALRVAFQHQRVDFRHLSQLLVLPPGAYSMSGRVRLDALRNERGLIWQVQCVSPGSMRLGSSEPFRGASPWRGFSFDFEVPAEGCPAQWLRLELDARAAADRFIGGEVWFDALRIWRRRE